jgi:hypothetical protein
LRLEDNPATVAGSGSDTYNRYERPAIWLLLWVAHVSKPDLRTIDISAPPNWRMFPSALTLWSTHCNT